MGAGGGGREARSRAREASRRSLASGSGEEMTTIRGGSPAHGMRRQWSSRCIAVAPAQVSDWMTAAATGK